MKTFQVDLKACLGLVLPTPVSFKKIEAGFWVILLRGARLLPAMNHNISFHFDVCVSTGDFIIL